MSPSVKVGGKTLHLNGEGTQRKFIFRIYQVGLYLERPAKEASDVLKSEQTKLIRLRLLRDVAGRDLAKAMRSGLARSGVDVAPLEERLQKLFSVMPDFKSGEELRILYVPGEGTTLQATEGEKLEFAGKDFADAMFSIWLGRDPETARVKGKLLGEVEQQEEPRPGGDS